MSWGERLAALRNEPWELAFWGVLLGLLPVMTALSFDFGITWDEHYHVKYGEMVLDFFASGLQDKAALDYLSLYLYGGFFDLLCALGKRALFFLDEYDARHCLTSAFGWLTIFSSALLARRVFGVKAGLTTALFLALSPTFFAHCMNNPKDIPFAAFFMLTVYCLSLLRTSYPYASAKMAAAIVCSAALSINVRVGGLLLLFYASLYLFALAVRDRRNLDARRWAKLGAGFAVCAALTLVLGSLFWPWALQNPLLRPIQALSQLSRFPVDFNELYGGEIIWAKDTPWDYIFRWFGITSPLGVLLFGLASPFVLARRPEFRASACLWFAALFPAVYVTVRHTVLYNGIRHLLFVYPAFVVLAAAACVALLQSPSPWRRWAAIGLLVVGFYHPARFHLVNHPNQAAYFNQIVGGALGAFSRYDLDYWGVSYKQAVDKLEKIARMNQRVVTFNAGVAGHVAGAYARRFPNLRFVKGDAEYTLDLALGCSELPAILEEGYKVDAIEVDGAPLCLIKLRSGVPTN
jgi:4-amino-4-deoxy-L-arabinose transferase-like glycosyltransferase